MVSVITPTKPDRLDLLVGRCIPSVDRVAWSEVEHVIVSDPNPTLRNMHWAPTRRVVEINDSWRDGVRDRSVGAVPWMVGSLLALGQWIAFLGDDDELHPDHVQRHVAAMETAGADFSVSPVEFVVRGNHHSVIGDSFAHGHLDAIGIMCRASALRVANWTATGEDAADHRLVTEWLARGLVGVLVTGPPTARHHDGWAAG